MEGGTDMKDQRIVVALPDIQLIIDGTVAAQLEPFAKEVSTLKILRRAVENHIHRFIRRVNTVASKEVVTTKRPLRDFRFPGVKVVHGDKILCRFSEFSGYAKLDLGDWRIGSTLSKVPSVIADTCAEQISGRKVATTFVDYGITFPCTIERKAERGRSMWTWQFLVTETMIKYERGKEVNIKYGSFLHNALWRLNKEWRVDEMEAATIETLRALGLANMVRLTPRGSDILEDLATIDPSDTPSLVIPFAGVMVGYATEATPMFHFATDNEFMRDRPTGGPEILQRGREWLIDNCLTIISHSNCSNERKLKLVRYMPLEQLPVFLAHEDSKIRSAARARANELGEVVHL